MTLAARLCALCAVSALAQMAFSQERRAGLRVIGGLLMLHLVFSGAAQLWMQMSSADSLMRIFEIMVK